MNAILYSCEYNFFLLFAITSCCHTIDQTPIYAQIILSQLLYLYICFHLNVEQNLTNFLLFSYNQSATCLRQRAFNIQPF